MRILLIEDSEDIAEAITAKLSRAGHVVRATADGHDGEELAISGGFEIVVLDINLPGQDGFAVLREMRRAKNNTPVLVITARNQIEDKIGLLDLGADDYMVKPFDLRELEARIRAVVRRKLGASQSSLEVGQLMIDLATRAVLVSGKPADIGKREFEVLELLASHLGQIVSKDALVVRLFGYDDVGTPNAVELLVSRLRRKLKDSGVEILTQRGVGYMLRLENT